MAKFKKEIIRVGEYYHPDAPDGKLDVTLDRINNWIDNFTKAGIKVWLPIRHSKDPRDNTGWVTGLLVEDDKLIAELEVTDKDIATRLEDGTIKDVSIGIEFDFTDDKGNIFDEIIRHVALTVDPHIREQEGFIAAEYNIDIIRGGDTMSEITEGKVMGWINEHIAAAIPGPLKPDVKLTAELETAEGKVTELEGKVTELEAVTKERDTLKTEKDTADAKALQLEWDAEWDKGCQARKVTPGEKDIYLEATPDPEKLKTAIEARPVNKDINLEGAKTVKNPNDGLTEADRQAITATGHNPDKEEEFVEDYLKNKNS